MAYPKNTTKVSKNWVEKTLQLKPGEELFIPCDNKTAQINLKTRLYGARKEYSSVDPIGAESISFSPVFRDGQPFVKCYKSPETANKGFIKSADGTIREVTIEIGPGRKVQILTMIKNKKTIEEVEEEIGELEDWERNLFTMEIEDENK